eukprot:TRINITY_DN6212_c0_g1_i1.p1 TRINITY_DN6212_c0_g1~~TRINITY_DN6212_c0_g1_i1.p1  ORF type:complete len:431 (+),score=156.01 TRINITY_DN6212_c0_g1_i1:198-1490(+)
MCIRDRGVGTLTVEISCKFIAPNVDDTPSDMSDLDNTSQMSFGTDVGSEDEMEAPKPVDGAQFSTNRTETAVSPVISQSDQSMRDRVAQLEEQLAEQEELVADLRRQNTDLSIVASGNSSEQKCQSDSLQEAQQEILRLQTAHRDSLQSESAAKESAEALKEQLSQVQMDLETTRRDADSNVQKHSLELQAQREQRQEVQRELDNLQAESQRERAEAETARSALLLQLEQAQSPEKSDPADQAEGGVSPESSVDLAKHLHEMLEMRGQELDEAKKRLQNFKEKLKEAQEEAEAANVKNEQLSKDLVEMVSKEEAVQDQLSELKEVHAADAQSAKQATEELEQHIKALESVQKEPASAADPEMEAHVMRIEGMLIEAKMAWAQAEEDKAMAELRARQLRDQVAKGRELNLQFAKRMTKLEVKLSKAKETKK